MYKGPDLIKIATSVSEGISDEIREFVNSRYVSATEAAWRIFGYHINRRNISCTALPFHLPNEHTVIYNENEDAEVAANTAVSCLY